MHSVELCKFEGLESHSIDLLFKNFKPHWRVNLNMPRPFVIPRLERLSLASFVPMMLRGCHVASQSSKRHNSQIEALSRSIPRTLADDYMEELMWLGRKWSVVNIRNAMCPWCTHLTLESTQTDLRVARNLGKLKDLTSLTVKPRRNTNVTIEDVVKGLPHLQRLKCLRLDGEVTDDMNLIEKVVDHCPCLEELSFEWGMSPIQPMTLGSCQKLRKVCVQYFGESVKDLLAILRTVPQLDTLTFSGIWKGNMAKSLLKTCHGPYRLRILEASCDEGIGNDLECLARHFPELQGSDMNLDGCDLSPINRMVHLKELGLSECTWEQVSVVDGAVFARLESLRLDWVADVQKLLGLIRSPLQGMEKLSLMGSGQVDLVQISNLFPNLSSLDLNDSQLTSLVRNDGKPFSHLERLVIEYEYDGLRLPHLAYLLSHSCDLKFLSITLINGVYGSSVQCLDDSSVHSLLRRNPLIKLKKLSLCSDRLTPSVTSVVFDYFGEDLESVQLYGQQMNDLPVGFLDAMQEKVKPYLFSMSIGNQVRTYLTRNGQMHLR